jgi:MFS family permease
MPLINYSFLNKILPKAKIKKGYRKAKQSYLMKIRWATALFFFGMGFSFATWASRIPDIKSMLHLSEADLGGLLFALPVGQLIAMPFSGKIVTKYGSKQITIFGLLLYSACMPLLGLATSKVELGLALLLFGFFGNFCNIAVNTQGVYTQQLFEKPIMGSFHGSWSLAGFCGALVGLIMVSLELSVFNHFSIAFAIVCLLVLANYSFLIKAKTKQSGEQTSFSF